MILGAGENMALMKMEHTRLRALLFCIALSGLTGACVRAGFSVDRPNDSGAFDLPPAGPDGATDSLPVSDLLPDSEPWPAGGRWTPTTTSPLVGRRWIFSAWTGKQFAVFGGAVDDQFKTVGDGALYDPVSRIWTKMQPTGALSKRHAATVVWDGTRLLWFGGGYGFSAINGGSRYNPTTNSWAPMSNSGAGGARIYHIALWTGSRMMAWGGYYGGGHYSTGLLYDPVADKWTPTSTTNAPSPRNMLAAVWTGSEALIWGGCHGAMGSCPSMRGDGARYNPVTNKWTPLASAGAPSPRKYHSAVWTGSRMIVFGGCAGGSSTSPLGDGASYDPSKDSWTTLSKTAAPAPRCRHAAVWLPALSRMVVWGGAANTSTLGDGHLYDPLTDMWSPMATSETPTPRARFASAANDRCLFIWGGADEPPKNHFSTGGVWCGAAP